MIILRTCIFGGLIIQSWLNTVIKYFTFVHFRSPATSHSVLPERNVLLATILPSLVAIYAFYQFADPAYIDWFLAGNVDKEGLFYLTTDIGQSHWILVSSGSVLLFMSGFNFMGLSLPQQIHWHHIFLKFYFAFSTVAFSGLLVIALKNLIGRARPIFFETPDVWFSSPLTHPYMFASFPSGHTATMAALASVLYLVAPRISLVFIPVAIWVSISRLVVGAHFPSDIAAGLVLGIVFTWFYARLFARKRLLFEFSENGNLQLRNLSAKRARRKIRKNAKSLKGLGLGLSRRAVDKKA